MYFTYATQILTYQTGPNLESIWRLGIGQRKNREDIYGDGKVSLFILMPFFFLKRNSTTMDRGLMILKIFRLRAQRLIENLEMKCRCVSFLSQIFSYISFYFFSDTVTLQ